MVCVDIMINKLNNFYKDKDYENWKQFKRNQNDIYKFTYSLVYYDDGNISMILTNSCYKEYEKISVCELKKEYQKIN